MFLRKCSRAICILDRNGSNPTKFNEVYGMNVKKKKKKKLLDITNILKLTTKKSKKEHEMEKKTSQIFLCLNTFQNFSKQVSFINRKC